MHHLDNKSANLFSEAGIYVALICTLYFEHKNQICRTKLKKIYDPYQHQQLKAAHRLDCHKKNCNRLFETLGIQNYGAI